MKSIIVVLLTILMITLSTKVFSQEEPRNRIGVGISLDPARIGQQDYFINTEYPNQGLLLINQSPIVFYLPIQIFERLRVEPTFGLFSSNKERATVYNSWSYVASYEVSSVEIGLRALYISPFSSSFTLYCGSRLSFIFLSSTFFDSYVYSDPTNNRAYRAEVNETDVTVGGIFGAEFFPVLEFSVGGECGLAYTSFSSPKVSSSSTPPPSPNDTPTLERKQHSWRTDALFFVRWYFL